MEHGKDVIKTNRLSFVGLNNRNENKIEKDIKKDMKK